MTAAGVPSTEDPLAFLTELKRGGELILENAQQLCEEALLLRKNAAFARAVCLHQLSNEECGKIELLGGWAMSIVLGHEVNVAAITKALSNHRAKNFANAYFSGVTADERSAREQRDWGAALAIFRRRQAEMHALFNEQKNATLYVNFEGGKFSAPKHVVNEALADEMAELNSYFLWLASNNVRLLGNLISDNWNSRSAAKRLEARLEECRRDQPDDLEGALEKVIQEMLAEVRADLMRMKRE